MQSAGRSVMHVATTGVCDGTAFLAACTRHLCICRAEESAALLTPKQLGQLNKELSTLQPVVDALTILAKQRQEVRHATFSTSLLQKHQYKQCL